MFVNSLNESLTIILEIKLLMVSQV